MSSRRTPPPRPNAAGDSSGDLSSSGYWRSFSPNSRSRGRTLWGHGLVTSMARKGGRVEAIVLGGVPYRVSLEITEFGGIAMSCTCPAFGAERECKHAFATLLEMERRGWLDPRKPAEFTGAERAQWEMQQFEQRLGGLRQPRGAAPVHRALAPRDLPLVYVLPEEQIANSGYLCLEPMVQRFARDGSPSGVRALTESERHGLRSESDRQILAWLAPGEGELARTGPRPLDEPAWNQLVPLLGAGASLLARRSDGELVRIELDPEPWRFVARITEQGDQRQLVGYAVGRSREFPLASPEGTLCAPWRARGGRRGEATASEAAAGPRWITRQGWMLEGNVLRKLDWGESRELALELCLGGPLPLPAELGERALARVAPLAGDRLEAEHGGLGRAATAPKPRLRLLDGVVKARAGRDVLVGAVDFLYGDLAVSASDAGVCVESAGGATLWRDLAAEGAACEQLADFAIVPLDAADGPDSVGVPVVHLPELVEALNRAGWVVEIEGRAAATSSGASARVSSGIDWFGLEGALHYGGESVPLPTLLQSVRRGQRWVRLKDGRVGLLPSDWGERWGWLDLSRGTQDGALTFGKSQAFLLDALLAGRADVSFDREFQKTRKALAAFESARPLGAPKGLVGELRAYQNEGLGWLDALAQLGLGGCLADDMGLGKTVQVLAFLERRRTRKLEDGQERRPSLVVAPRSILFNWMEEARRFAPKLTFAEHHGTQRWQVFDSTREADVIITTYGTLRNDAKEFSEIAFDVVVLDEAQAIKNAASQVAKAARLLQARVRFALTGTPVENRLEDLWSLFEFLNPGMLGGASGFRRLLSGSGQARQENLTAIARAMRPFFLRRTKAQVLADLPEKTEQTLFVELDGHQRKAYDQLAEYYRKLLLGAQPAEQGGRDFAGQEFEVLTALLRLRQCACHEGLLDPARAHVPSAKLDALLERLEEVAREGNKALVFSQFTSFLALLKPRLEAAGIPFEYLDGQTNDRQGPVARFQQDPACPVFLVSLKAGGVGLNLTAADYVFLLDPWWNPAVENQAIDRAHRIGRTRPVVAYRIVARDTIEERVLELQATKRELVAGLFDESSGSIRNLSRADLERLL